MKSNRSFLVVLLVLMPLAGSWMYKEVIHQRPHWIEYYDPEMAYYFSGIELLQGGSPSHIDHPGTPLQWLMAAAIRLTSDHPEKIPTVQRLAKTLLFVLVAIAVTLLRSTLFRGMPVMLSSVGILFFYVSGQALRYLNVIAPESLYLFCSATFAAVFWGLAINPLRNWRILLAGMALGFCIAVKFLYLVWIPGLLISIWLLARKNSLVSKLSGLIRACTGVVIGFAGTTFTAAPRYDEMFSWLSNLAVRAGPYGTGAPSWPDPGTLVTHWVQAFLSAKGWYLLLCLTICACIAGLIHQHKTKCETSRGLTVVVVFVVISLMSSHLLLARTFTIHYLLPNAMLGVMAFAAAAHLWRDRLKGWRAVPPVLIVGSLFAKSFSWDVTLHQRLVENGTALRKNIQEIVDTYSSSRLPVVIYSFRFPTASYANRIYATPEYQTRLDEFFPYEGHYLPWSRQLRLPSGADTWDLLVIRKRDLVAFPEEKDATVGEVGVYAVVQRARE